jgi:hypothetical protein
MGVLEMDMPLIAQIDLPMNEPGAYIMSVAVDGEPAAEVPVQVRSLGATAPAAGRPFSGLVS